MRPQRDAPSPMLKSWHRSCLQLMCPIGRFQAQLDACEQQGGLKAGRLLPTHGQNPHSNSTLPSLP